MEFFCAVQFFCVYSTPITSTEMFLCFAVPAGMGGAQGPRQRGVLLLLVGVSIIAVDAACVDGLHGSTGGLSMLQW